MTLLQMKIYFLGPTETCMLKTSSQQFPQNTYNRAAIRNSNCFLVIKGSSEKQPFPYQRQSGLDLILWQFYCHKVELQPVPPKVKALAPYLDRLQLPNPAVLCD